MSCKTEQKAQSSFYRGKLALTPLTAMHVLTPADCSKQMQQLREGTVASGSIIYTGGAWSDKR